jgi:hypothetical protein
MSDMNPHSLFRLAAAVLGLYSFYSGLVDLIAAALLSLSLADEVPGVAGTERYWFVRGLLEVALGVLLMSRIIPLERLAFPGGESCSKEDSKEHLADG